MSTLIKEEKFEKIFKYSQDPIFIIHPATDTIMDANPAASNLLGYSLPELLDTPISTIHPDEMPALIRFTSQVYKNGEGWTDELFCLTKHGKKLNVEMSATNMKINDLDCIIVIARDISARIESEIKLVRKVKFEELVSSISSKFLQCKSDDLDDLIKCTLQELGEFSRVDRCYLYQDVENNNRYVNTAEWVMENQPKLIDIQNSLDDNAFKWVHDQLRDFKTVHIPDIDEIPDTEPQLHTNLNNMGIKSCLVVPLNYVNELIGFIGFDNMASHKTWGTEDIQLLQVVGEIIVSAIERKKYEEDLHRINSELNELNLALELKVNERAQQIISQREKLTNYAYYNAHKLRAPLARLLGLVSLIDKGVLSEIEMEVVIRKIQEAGAELDEIVKEINKIVS